MIKLATIKKRVFDIFKNEKFKRTILILSFITLTVASPIAYFSLRNGKSAYSWYNSSWQYRKPISVTNSVATKTNFDVMVTLDTSALISAGKLQSDCDDFRFVDSDDTTVISHWIETGCNTTATVIWARIPSLPSGGKTIYMYYGNNSATNTQLAWTGNIVMLRDSACPTGWTQATDFDAKFPYGDTAHGATAGSSSHSHSNVSGTSTGITSGSRPSNGNVTDGSGGGSHTHSFTVGINTNATVLPPYKDTVYCYAPTFLIPANNIAIYKTLPSSGWTRFSALDSVFARGSATYGATGGSTTHAHTIPNTSTGSGMVFVGCKTNSQVLTLSVSHTHSISSQSVVAANNVPPYVSVIYGQNNAQSNLPTGAIVMSTVIPPLGWTRLVDLDGKIPYGSATYGTTGGTATHAHSISFSVGGSFTESATCGSAGSNAPTIAGAHTHTISGTSSSFSNTPPTRSTLFIEKNNNTTSGVTNSIGSEETDFPLPPTIETPEALSTTSIRWHFSDNAISEIGFKVFDMSGNLKVTCVGADLAYCDETGLTPNTQYTRQLKAYNVNGDSLTYSGSASIYTQLPIPTIVSPADNSLGLNSPVVFQFYTTESSVTYLQYRVDICENKEMTINCSSADQTSTQTGWSGQDAEAGAAYASGTTATYTKSGLIYGHQYYWRAFAIDPDTSNTWTIAQTPYFFTTNAMTRSNTTTHTNIFSATRAAEYPSTTTSWTNIPGNVDSNTTASTNGWIDSTNLINGRKYLVILSGSHSTDSTTGKSALRVTHGGTPFTPSQDIAQTTVTTASYKKPTYWFTIWTAQSGEDLEVELYWNGTGSQARAEDVTLVAFDAQNLIDDGYLKYSENIADTDLTTTLQDIETLTFTPTTANQVWWIIGYSQANQTYVASSRIENKLLVGATTYGTNITNVDASSTTPIHSLGTVLALPNTSQTIKIQAREYVSDQQTIASGIFALNLTAFEDYAATYNTSGNLMTSSGSWVNQFTLKALNSHNSSEWLITGGSGITDSGSRVISRIQENVTSITDDIGTSNVGTTDSYSSIIMDYYQNLASGNNTFKYDTQTTLSGTAVISNPWMVAFSREKYPNYPSQDQPTNGNPSVTIRPVIKITSTDPDGDSIMYKIKICDDGAMTTGCQTKDQTSSQTGWSGQNANSSTRYSSGTQATYTFQSDLTAGNTYYWIAYSKDPSGTNTWTDEDTSPNSFTISLPPTTPTGLLAEGVNNPINVTDLTPEFSAIHNDPDGDSAASYQIQVNTASDFTGTSMWDSGKQSITVTNGARSSDISYAGTVLGLTGETFFWRIKFWDSTDAQGAWSSVSQFSMRLIEKATACYLVKSVDNTSLTLKWKDNTSDESGYKIQRKVDGGAWTDLVTKLSNTITHTDSTISNGHTYQYRVTPLSSGYSTTFCTTDIASVFLGSIKFEGLKMDGIQIF